MRMILVAQWAALVLACGAIIWCLGCVHWLLVPDGSGEWVVLSVLAAYCAIPAAAVALSVGIFVKKGSPRLRQVCITMSVIALAMPLVVNLLFRFLR